jgi:hypothetical protein
MLKGVLGPVTVLVIAVQLVPRKRPIGVADS